MPVLVYGLVEPGTRVAGLPRGVDGAKPRLVDSGQVAAVVADLDRDELVARRRDLAAYMDVLGAAMERSTLLPVRFGTVMGDDEEVRAELLDPLGDRLRALLNRFENLVELRLAVRYDEQALLAEIVAGDGEIRRLRKAASKVPEDAATPVRLRLGELVAHAYERLREREARELLARIELLVEDEVRADGDEWDLLTVSLLVRRGNVAAVEDTVGRWAREQAARVHCELAGPMPPYSFVDPALEEVEPAWA